MCSAAAVSGPAVAARGTVKTAASRQFGNLSLFLSIIFITK
jgi:hypothetical protein